MVLERETTEFMFYRDMNSGRPSYTYKYQEEYNTLMNDLRETALYRYIHKSGITYPEEWYCELGLDEITENDIHNIYPDMPNVNYDLLRNWWRLHKPLAEEIYYEEWVFEREDEPSDRELLITFIMVG